MKMLPLVLLLLTACKGPPLCAGLPDIHVFADGDGYIHAFVQCHDNPGLMGLGVYRPGQVLPLSDMARRACR